VPSSQAFAERKGLFFSTEQVAKMTMINDMAQLWGLPPYITPEGTPAPVPSSQASAERRGLFFFAEQAGKITMINDMAQL